MTMDRETFLARLRETPRVWSLIRSGAIRCACKSRLICPIAAVLGLPTSISAFVTKEMPQKLRDDIIDAADNRRNADPALRAQLLEACGLQEAHP